MLFTWTAGDGVTWRKAVHAQGMAGITMANRRIAMSKIRQVLRLAHEAHISKRGISERLGLSRDVVTNYLSTPL